LRAGRFLEDFQENVGDVVVHGVCAVEDENAAAAHGLKVGSALDGAQLATRTWACYRAFQADWIGHECPDVRVRLQD